MKIPSARFHGIFSCLRFMMAIVLICVVLAGCAPNDKLAPQPVATYTMQPEKTDLPVRSQPGITVWTHNSPTDVEGYALWASRDAYVKSHPDSKIELVPIPEYTYTEQVTNSALSGDLPCVLDLDGPLLSSFVWSGYLQPIEPFVSKEMRDDFLSSIVSQGTTFGQLYSLGQFDSGMVIYGNRQYLTAAQVRIPTLENPWTLVEFEQTLEKLSKLPQVKYAIDMKINSGRGEWATYGFSPILQSFGGDLINRSTYTEANGVLDGERSVEAMRHFQMWFQKGWAVVDISRDDAFYGTRTAALAWAGHWMYSIHAEKLGDDLLILPTPDFGYGVKTGMGSWTWGITSSCKNPSEAWSFINHLLSPEEILRVTNANGAVPARQSVLSKSRLYNDTGPLHLILEELQGGYAVPRPITPAYPMITDAFSRAVGNIFDGADVQMELTYAAKRIDQDITNNHGYGFK